MLFQEGIISMTNLAKTPIILTLYLNPRPSISLLTSFKGEETSNFCGNALAHFHNHNKAQYNLL